MESATKNLQTPTLPQSLEIIAQRLTHAGPLLTPEKLVRIIREANVQPADLLPWADYDHPVADSYGRKLVFKGKYYEIMVMSWRPGDFSTIHDHGHAQWGAVQIFGPAEHAIFRVAGGRITTETREVVKPYDIVSVCNDLIHQMGNPTDDRSFLSLHIYGATRPEESITGDARIYDVQNQTIQRVDGGVFFALPDKDINSIEAGPEGDFSTWLRHMVELTRRLRRMRQRELEGLTSQLEEVRKALFDPNRRLHLIEEIQTITDANDHYTDSRAWQILNTDLKAAAQLQREIQSDQHTGDAFHKYAELYDALICQPCLDNFMAGYLDFFQSEYQQDFSNQNLLSLGCGTGLVERHIIGKLGMKAENIFGIDKSEAMVSVASRHIDAQAVDFFDWQPENRQWDIAFSGLNVFHYLDHHRLQEAINKTASLVKPGGYFVGDFITPDHMRWYPNVIYSRDQQIISLRTPRFIEVDGYLFQESEIINTSFLHGEMNITHAGKHRRFLPPMNRIRRYFQQAFGRQVEIFDAHSLEQIDDAADTCASTRYVVVARRS